MEGYKFKQFDTSGLSFSRKMSDNFGDGRYASAVEAHQKRAKNLGLFVVLAAVCFTIGFGLKGFV